MHGIGLLGAALIVTALLQIDPSQQVDFTTVGFLWVVAIGVGALSIHGLYQQMRYGRRMAKPGVGG